MMVRPKQSEKDVGDYDYRGPEDNRCDGEFTELLENVGGILGTGRGRGVGRFLDCRVFTGLRV